MKTGNKTNFSSRHFLRLEESAGESTEGCLALGSLYDRDMLMEEVDNVKVCYGSAAQAVDDGEDDKTPEEDYSKDWSIGEENFLRRFPFLFLVDYV